MAGGPASAGSVGQASSAPGLTVRRRSVAAEKRIGYRPSLRHSERSDYDGAVPVPITPHPATLEPQKLLADCHVRRTRGSGPGGQRRNKVETAVVITHQPTGIRGSAAERRQQVQNQRIALFRLRVNLALEIRCAVAPDADPSALWRSRCRDGRVVVNPRHDDMPALLAEALDRLAAVDMDVKPAAASLGCSATQLVKLLKAEPRALAAINEHRRQRDLPPLR